MLKQLAFIGCAFSIALAANATRAELVVVVSQQSPITALSRERLTDLYLGRLHRLPGGEPITPIDQSERSPAHNRFYNEYLGRSPAQIKAHWSRLIFTGRGQPPRSLSDGAAVADFLAEHPNAVGYLDSELVNERLRVLSID